MQAAANLNFELLADFRRRLLALLAEFNINGRKRQELCDAITALVIKHFDADQSEKVLAEVRRGLETTKARAAAGLVRSVPGVGIKILEEYAETGQMVLFEMPAEVTPEAAERNRQAEREKMRQLERTGAKFRRPQASYTDEERQRKQEEARQRLAARRATS